MTTPAERTHCIWVVDDDQAIAWVLQKALQKAGYEVVTLPDVRSAVRSLSDTQRPPDVILSDIRMPQESGLQLVDYVRAHRPDTPVIIMTAFGDLDSAVGAFKQGAFDYLTKPFDIDAMLQVVSRAINSAEPMQADAAAPLNPLPMLGHSAAMQGIFRVIGRLSSSSMNVLIRGESGTGKQLVAQALHQNSPRSGAPMIEINTAAIPTELLESELFGHEKGAFTGAYCRRTGRFEQSNGSTLLLDEIGDMPLMLQTRLLRVLSEGRFFRVGGHEEIQADVRIIAATNQDLEKQVETGCFRLDLFHRLNVISLSLPPLRERGEDVVLLAKHFLARATDKLQVEAKYLSKPAQRRLSEYHWPGNVRELESMMQRLAVMVSGRRITAEDVSLETPQSAASSHHGGADSAARSWRRDLHAATLSRLTAGETGLAKTLAEQFERVLIVAALSHTGGHRRQAAAYLGWSRNTLSRKIRQLGIDTGPGAAGGTQ